MNLIIACVTSCQAGSVPHTIAVQMGVSDDDGHELATSVEVDFSRLPLAINRDLQDSARQAIRNAFQVAVASTVPVKVFGGAVL
jgi:hypothetical protein